MADNFPEIATIEIETKKGLAANRSRAFLYSETIAPVTLSESDLCL